MYVAEGKFFREYAGHNQERWNFLVEREITHTDYGKGSVREVIVEDHEISIKIDFDQPNGKRSLWFGLQAMNHVTSILFPDPIVQQIAKSLSPEERQRSPQNRNQIELDQQAEPPSISYPPQQFKPNTEVYLANKQKKRGRISRPRMFTAGEWNYEVYFSAEDVRIFKESDLRLYTPKVHWGGIQDLLSALALVKLNKPLGDALYALYGSRTKFEVYQFKPAVKFLSNPDQRLLIADEVGLGKTIEAGIIYLELQARIGLDRVLVVCPSSLRHKWHDEMKSRFDEEFSILDSTSLRSFLDHYQQTGGRTHLRGIVSLELIRRRDFYESFKNTKFDLLIIDEAHHCRNTGTLAHAIASTLTENSDAALMLTATPLQMGREDLFNLLSILSPGEFDNYSAFLDRLVPNQFINRAAQFLSIGKIRDALQVLQEVEQTSEKNRFIKNPYYQTVIRILGSERISQQELITAQRRLLELNTLSSVFTRTRKRDIQEKAPKRTAFTLPVRFSREEKRFYNQVIEEVRQEFANSHWNGAGSGWVTIMKERQAASCISALQKRKNEQSLEEEAFQGDFLLNNNGSTVLDGKSSTK